MEEQPQVDEHAYTDEEVRDEDGVARELQPVHQRRYMGDVAVHDESCKEGAYDAFQSHRLAEGSTHEEHAHNEDELHHCVAVAAQEPACQAWNCQQQHYCENGELRKEPYPERYAASRLMCCHQCCQTGECEQQCQHRPSHAQRDAGFALQAVSAYDRVGNERVRRHQCAEQERCLVAVMQQPYRCEIGEDERYQERQQTEHRHARNVLTQAFHIHL